MSPEQRKALKGLAVSKRMIEAAQSTYKRWEEYGLSDEDMAKAIRAAIDAAAKDR